MADTSIVSKDVGSQMGNNEAVAATIRENTMSGRSQPLLRVPSPVGMLPVSRNWMLHYALLGLPGVFGHGQNPEQGLQELERGIWAGQDETRLLGLNSFVSPISRHHGQGVRTFPHEMDHRSKGQY